MSKIASRILLGLIIVPLFVVAVVAALWCYRVQPSQHVDVAPGDEVRFDDFGFQVAGPAARDDNHPGVVMVGVVVSNHAKQVSFTLRPEVLRLVDDGGNQRAPVGSCTRGCEQAVPAGDSCRVDLCYELPGQASPRELVFRFGGRLLGAIDVAFLGDRRLLLP